MMNARAVAIFAVGCVCFTHALEGQTLSEYRNFVLGSDLTTVSTLAGVAASEASTIHQRPATLQRLEWRPSRWLVGSTVTSTDPVEEIVFSFFNDQLFEIAVHYSRERTQGMTVADMIEAVSAIYGGSLPVTSTASPASRFDGSDVARWGDAEHAIVLYQASTYRSAFRLTLTDVRLGGLAKQAATQALQLDRQEAPRRELDRQKKERDDAQAAAEKARATNKAVFRP